MSRDSEMEEDKASVLNSAGWKFAGLASAFPNIDSSDLNVCLSSSSLTTTGQSSSVCKILQISNKSDAEHVLLEPTDAAASVGLKTQVLIFQYRGKFHAIDHQCPHRSFPLSRGTLYDIEDFGIRLSVGLTCPKHGWAFDICTGESDRGAYRLKVWDVEVRGIGSVEEENREHEIWIKQRSERSNS